MRVESAHPQLGMSVRFLRGVAGPVAAGNPPFSSTAARLPGNGSQWEPVVVVDPMQELAVLLRQRNEIDAQIAQLIERPMTSGHLGEYIAAKIFDIELESSAVAPAIDGRFRSGPLVGKTVNVKWYLKQEGVLDVSLSEALDYYLVLTGPQSAAGSSKGGTRPWQIDAVYLFDSKDLLTDLTSRGIKVGVATSVRKAQWEAAEIYPASANPVLPVSVGQSAQLTLFGR